MQYNYYLSTSEFRASKPNYNVLTSGIDVGCSRYANWDIRLTDIVNTRCIQLQRKCLCLRVFQIKLNSFIFFEKVWNTKISVSKEMNF